MSERDEFEDDGPGYEVSAENARRVLRNTGYGELAQFVGASAPQAVPALTDEQIEGAVVEACHSDPRSITPGEYCLSLDEIRNVLVLLAAAPQPSPEPQEPAHAHDWRFSLQDHVYKCDCGATRGDYPFGAASFKD